MNTFLAADSASHCRLKYAGDGDFAVLGFFVGTFDSGKSKRYTGEIGAFDNTKLFLASMIQFCF